ncbi:MAG: secondary thiamine-phosphate synthase enzyme YjbQ [Sphaerochaetaceae bacterium]
MRKEFKLETPREGFLAITDQINAFIATSGVKEGIVVVHSPHTTAGITVNENSDPAVKSDLLMAMQSIFSDDPRFQHLEGNSAAHLKCSMVGSNTTLIIKEGRLDLGIWQDVYFCEFDGKRNRRFICKIIAG